MGEYQNGQPHGEGIQRWLDIGRVTQGNYIKGFIQGASLTKRKDWSYFGQKEDDKYHGLGVFKNPVGDYYCGVYNRGEKHGLGME